MIRNPRQNKPCHADILIRIIAKYVWIWVLFTLESFCTYIKLTNTSSLQRILRNLFYCKHNQMLHQLTMTMHASSQQVIRMSLIPYSSSADYKYCVTMHTIEGYKETIRACIFCVWYSVNLHFDEKWEQSCCHL